MGRKSFSKKTAVSISLGAFMLVTAACSGGNSASSTAAQTTSSSTPNAPTPSNSGKAPVVTALLSIATDFPANNPVIEEIRKGSGVDLQVQTVTTDQTETRLNTLLVSGKAPDIFNVPKSKLQELVNNKVIMPLDDLIKQAGPNITENKGADLKGPAFINGKVYGIPNSFLSGSALAIRQDWLDKLHLQVPTTLDQFEEVLKAFVNNDPDGNGQKDTIGLGTAILVDQTWQAVFGAFNVPMNQAMLIDGKVTPWMLDPGYLDAIKYLNKLRKEGLIDPEFATVPTLQSFQKLWNGKVGAYNFNADGTTQNWLTRYVEKTAPKFTYTVLKGPDGHGGYPKQVAADAGSYTVISSKAKDPVAAMKLLDYMVSKKGDTLTWAGIEGTSYKYVNNQFQWIPPYDDAVKLRDFGGYMYSVLLNRTNGLREQLFNNITRQGRKLVDDNSIDSAYIFGIPQIQVDKGKILSDMEKEFRTNAIMADSSLDPMYADFKKNYLANGGSEWIEQATKIYNDEQAARR